MTLTIDQVAALAPDALAASAGRKLGSPAPWRNLGRSERSLWGKCQGSAVYQGGREKPRGDEGLPRYHLLRRRPSHV